MRGKIIAVILVFIIVLISLHLYLVNSDIQSNRFVFLYQSKFLSPQEYLDIYNNYTGVWRTWHNNGKLMSVQNLVSGRVNGYYKYIFSNGQIYAEGEMKDGRHIRLKEWNSSGKLLVDGSFKDGNFFLVRQSFTPGKTSGMFTANESNTFFEQFQEGKLIKRIKINESGLIRSRWP